MPDFVGFNMEVSLLIGGVLVPVVMPWVFKNRKPIIMSRDSPWMRRYHAQAFITDKYHSHTTKSEYKIEYLHPNSDRYTI
jgi:hypothetical protein